MSQNQNQNNNNKRSRNGESLCCGCPGGRCVCLFITISLMILTAITAAGLIIAIVLAFLSVNYGRAGAWNPIAPFMDPLKSQTCGNFITIFSLFVKGVLAVLVFASEIGLFHCACFNSCRAKDGDFPRLIDNLQHGGFRGVLYICVGAVSACSVAVGTPGSWPDAVRTAIVVTTNLAPPMLVLCGVLYCCLGFCCCCGGDYFYHRRELIKWRRRRDNAPVAPAR